MNIWSKALYTSLGAAVGAGVVYYLTQKDSDEFQEQLDVLNEQAKEGCDSLREWLASDTLQHDRADDTRVQTGA